MKTQGRHSLRSFIGGFAVLLVTCAAAPATLAQQYNYSRVNFRPTDISDNGTIIESGPGGHFVIDRHGVPAPFVIAGATVGSLTGINSQELVAGNLVIAGVSYPYIATSDGLNWRTLPRVDGVDTVVHAITNNGKAIGNRTGPGFPRRGVVIDTRQGDEVTIVNYPGASSIIMFGGNDNGFLFGRALGPGVPPWWTFKDGVFEPLVFAPEVVPSTVNLAPDTNNRGDLLVYWRSVPDSRLHAGIQSANGRLQELVYPDIGAIALAESPPTFVVGFFLLYRVPYDAGIIPVGINERGDVVGNVAQGYSLDPSGAGPSFTYASLPRGFLAERGAGGP